MTLEEIIKENAEQKIMLETLTNTIDSMATSLDRQTKTIAQLNQTIADLKEQLNKNSRNSSKPPSSDGPAKPKSLRKPSGKKPRAQKGHKGSGLSLFATPDKTVVHKPLQCSGCRYEMQCTSCKRSAVRNVVDVEIKTTVTAHYTESYKCHLCNDKIIRGKFPEAITSSMQYGNGVKALAIALNTEGMMSIKRTHDILSAVLGLPISSGTINHLISQFSDKVSNTVEAIRKILLEKSVVNCDETGTRTEGTNFWVHSACDRQHTYLSLHKKRGKEGMKDAGFLPEYSGIIIHDFWKAYWSFNVSHGVCGAHLLRELNGVMDNYPEQKKWAKSFQKLLLNMNATKDKAIENAKTSLSRYYYGKFNTEYDRLMDIAKELNPEPVKVSGKRGCTKRGKVLCLIDRLIKHKGEVCLFINDFNVPFTNNIAEQSIRMVKVKTKVSGCFRTKTGASNFMTIRSYLGTAKKHGINTYNAIKSALAGQSYQILFGATE